MEQIHLRFLIFVCVLVLSHAQFIFPPESGPNQDFSENANLQNGSTQIINWRTNVSTFNIYLYQQSLTSGSAGSGSTLPVIDTDSDWDMDSSGALEFKWTVTPLAFSLQDSNVFFFWLNPGSGSSYGEETCHYFNITTNTQTTRPISLSSPPSMSSSTTISSNPSTSLTPLTMPTQSMLPATASTMTPGPTPQGLEESAKIGLGVGLGIGIPLLLLVGVLVGLSIHRGFTKDPNQNQEQPNGTPEDLIDPPPQYANKEEAMDASSVNQSTPAELRALHDRAEMDTERPRYELNS